MFTYSVPDFWLGMLLLSLFAVQLGWFPTGGFEDAGSTKSGLAALLDQLHHMFLPALTLTLAYIGEYMIIMRSSMIDTLNEDYLQLARAKGLRDALVRRKHAVPNALLPVVSLAALNFGFILSGAIAVEAIYSWPGLGQATIEAIRGPDYAMLQGLFLLFSASLIVANLIVDLHVRLPRPTRGGAMSDAPLTVRAADPEAVRAATPPAGARRLLATLAPGPVGDDRPAGADRLRGDGV